MSYTLEDLVAYERRRWTQPYARLFMSPDEERAQAERWRNRFLHLDRKLWNFHFSYNEGQADRTRAASAWSEARAPEYAGCAVAGASGPSLSELLKLKWDAAALRVQLAVIKHEIARRKAHGLPPLTEADKGWQIVLRNLARYQEACRRAGFEDADCKAGFNPDQPRVPAGNPDGGQWTSGSGAAGSDTGGGINDPRVLSDAAPDNIWIPGARYAQNASEKERLLKQAHCR